MRRTLRGASMLTEGYALNHLDHTYRRRSAFLTSSERYAHEPASSIRQDGLAQTRTLPLDSTMDQDASWITTSSRQYRDGRVVVTARADELDHVSIRRLRTVHGGPREPRCFDTWRKVRRWRHPVDVWTRATAPRTTPSSSRSRVVRADHAGDRRPIRAEVHGAAGPGRRRIGILRAMARVHRAARVALGFVHGDEHRRR